MLTWFTQDHADLNWLLKGVHNRPSQEGDESDVAYFRHVTRQEGIEKLFKERDLNLLAFSAYCLFFGIASAAGKLSLLSSPLYPGLQSSISLTFNKRSHCINAAWYTGLQRTTFRTRSCRAGWKRRSHFFLVHERLPSPLSLKEAFIPSLAYKVYVRRSCNSQKVIDLSTECIFIHIFSHTYLA